MVVVSITQLNCFTYKSLPHHPHGKNPTTSNDVSASHDDDSAREGEIGRQRRNLISFIVMPSCPSWNVVLHFDNLSHWDVISDNAPRATCMPCVWADIAIAKAWGHTCIHACIHACLYAKIKLEMFTPWWLTHSLVVQYHQPIAHLIAPTVDGEITEYIWM